MRETERQIMAHLESIDRNLQILVQFLTDAGALVDEAVQIDPLERRHREIVSRIRENA